MKYSRFEWLAIGVGIAAVGGTVALSLRQGPDWIEITAQLLLLVVLVAAVHWGRKGGMSGALLATLAYVLMRIPNMTSAASWAVVELVLIRAAAYGFIGVAGGEACSRIKYFFASLEDACAIDETSGVYNQRYLAQILETKLAESRRYGTVFCLSTITLSPLLTADLRPSRVTRLVRAVADHIRNDVRLVDEVGRLDDGRFALILAQTTGEGGRGASERVRRGVRDVLGAKDESVTAVVYDAANDLDAIEQFLDSLRPQAPETRPGSAGKPAG